MVSNGLIYSSVESLSSEAQANVEGYLLRCRKSNLCNADFQEWVDPMAVVNVRDREKFGVVSTTVFPAVTRESIYYDLKSQKALTVTAHWLAQGFPHPDVECLGSLRDDFPFNSDLVSQNSPSSSTSPVLSESQQRHLTGNAMHPSQFGSWFLFNVAFSHKHL